MEDTVSDRPRQRVVIVGAGFAGFHAARSLARLSRLTKGAAELVVVNSTDYFLYLPLLPEVAGGILDPRRVSVPLAGNCPGARLVLGTVDEIDLEARRIGVVDPEGDRDSITYDRLLLAIGSVNKLLPIPGVAEHAHGFRSIAEALYLRDQLVRQIELADASEDPEEREARCTFVVVGAGYTGMEVRTGTSVKEATSEGVLLSDGEFVRTRSLVWCVGVRPDPLVERLGLPTERGRLLVNEYLNVPDHPELFACGDAAAVPDLTRPGEITPMTAQHAERQGRAAARNLAASLGLGRRRAYRHHDLGFVVDLADGDGAANPLCVPLSGLPAKAVTRGYHLLTIPANRPRIAADWVLDAVLSRQTVQLGLVRRSAVPLAVETPGPPER